MFQSGIAHHRQKQWSEAAVDFRSAAQCERGRERASGLPYVALAELYVEKGDDNRALTNYESALQLRPDDPVVLRAAALLYVRHEMNEKAAPVLERLARLTPNDLQAQSDLAAVYAATGKLAEAQSRFEAALRLNPNHASALAGLGNLYLRTDRVGLAIPLLERAAALAVDSYEPHYLLGTAYARQERYEDSLAELEKALRMAENEPEISYQLAQVFGRLGRTEDRKRALARFSELKARSEGAMSTKREAALLIEKAIPLVNSGDLNPAIDLMEKAEHLDPQNADILFRLAGLYYDVRQYEAARRYVGRAIAIAPSDWPYHYLLGMIEKNTGRLDQARSELEIAVRLNRGAADVYNQLGDLAMRQNRPDEAIRSFERAVQINPQEAAYKLNLEAARRATKK